MKKRQRKNLEKPWKMTHPTEWQLVRNQWNETLERILRRMKFLLDSRLRSQRKFPNSKAVHLFLVNQPEFCQNLSDLQPRSWTYLRLVSSTCLVTKNRTCTLLNRTREWKNSRGKTTQACLSLTRHTCSQNCLKILSSLYSITNRGLCNSCMLQES